MELILVVDDEDGTDIDGGVAGGVRFTFFRNLCHIFAMREFGILGRLLISAGDILFFFDLYFFSFASFSFIAAILGWGKQSTNTFVSFVFVNLLVIFDRNMIDYI